MIDNLLGDDDDETADESDDEEMGGLFDDPGDGGTDGGMDDGMDGGMEGGDDDLMGGDDDLMGGDEMSFDDGDDGGTTNSEMNNRIDELENEVASLSSSVNTVKSENEQISESLDDVEENIRKLLEVYEMVTRGVNPFVNENELGDAFGGGGGGGGGGGSMGLFGDEQSQEADSSIDESVANADADDFFDDDLDDDVDEGDDFGEGEEFDEADDFEDAADEDLGGGDEFEESFDEDGIDDEFDDADDADDPLDEGSGGGGGKSFEELKSEYESGEAEWEDGEGDDDAGLEEADEADADAADEGEADEGGEDDGLDLGEPDLPAADSGTDDEKTADLAAGADLATSVDEAGDAPSEPATGPGEATADGKPYLQDLPAGYVADVVVMDWLEFLVDEGGVDGAARTIAYYEAIDWVSSTAAERLQTYLRGFGEDVVDDPEPRSWLTVAHHNTSLRFIGRIDDPSMELMAFDEWGGQPGRGRMPQAEPPATGRRPGRGTGGTAPPREGELESDGGVRTAGDRPPARYRPAVSRRRCEGPRDPASERCHSTGADARSDDGSDADPDGGYPADTDGGYDTDSDDEPTDEVGYGGFVWNDGGR